METEDVAGLEGSSGANWWLIEISQAELSVRVGRPSPGAALEASLIHSSNSRCSQCHKGRALGASFPTAIRNF